MFATQIVQSARDAECSVSDPPANLDRKPMEHAGPPPVLAGMGTAADGYPEANYDHMD